MAELALWHQYDDARLEVIRDVLDPEWTITLWDKSDGDASLSDLRKRADAIVSMSWTEQMCPADNLKLIHLPGAGLDAIDFNSVPDGCSVCNVYEHEIGIAEYCIASILELEVGVSAMHRRMRSGDWEGSFVLDSGPHGELFGKTVGIIGYGRIGSETARRLKAFGVTVMARTRTPSKTDAFVDDIGPMTDLDSMLGACDYVIVACPLTDATRDLMDAQRFSAMKSSGIVINVGRGSVINEQALYEACRDRRIGGAIIDTWYQYPKNADDAKWPSQYAFHRLDNVIMTPHASGWSAGLFKRRWTIIGENMNRVLKGEPLVNRVTAADQ